MSSEIHDLSAGYALNALDDADKVLFESHLPTCAQCQEDLKAHEETARLLGEAVAETPPGGLKNNVLSAIADIEQDEAAPAPSASVSQAPAAASTAPPEEATPPAALDGNVIDLRSRTRNRVLAAVAAAFVLIAALFGVQRLSAPDQTQYAAILESSDAEEAVLVGDGDAEFSVVWSASTGEFAVCGIDVPEITDDQTYEFWFIGDSDPVNVGLFDEEGGDVEFVGELPGDPAVWAITIEPAGGSPAPTSDILYSVAL